jgi:hypothetical protein
MKDYIINRELIISELYHKAIKQINSGLGFSDAEMQIVLDLENTPLSVIARSCPEVTVGQLAGAYIAAGIIKGVREKGKEK